MKNSVGSKFYSIDFHVHTPESPDYEDKDANPDDIVESSINSGLDAILVADHNSPCWIENLREAAKNKSLTIFPGFEINAQGGHILALFDPEAPIEIVETALIEAGIKKADWGNPDIVGKDLETVFRAITSNEGIVIAAHVDGAKGFLTALDHGAAKIKIFKDINLSALELTNLEKKNEYVGGKVAGYDRPIACVQGSDAHSLAKIGSRRTLVKMHHLSSEGIRLAFLEPTLKIRFPSEPLPTKYPNIEKIVVSQGFLSGSDIVFNPGLNSLVGGAGSGKSTIIEFIRFSLDQLSPNEDIKKDCFSKLEDLAGKGSKFHVVLNLDTGDQILVTRIYDGGENPFFVRKMPSKEPLDDVDVKGLFPILAYSQGEVVSISRDRLAQLELIDKHLEISDFKKDLSQAYKALESQIQGLVTLHEKVNEREVVDRDLATVKQRIEILTSELNSLEQAKNEPAFLTHHFWTDEKNFVNQLRVGLSQARSEIEEKIEQISFSGLSMPLPDDNTLNIDLIKSINQEIQTLQNAKDQTKVSLLTELSNIEERISKKLEIWNQAFLQHEAAYRDLEIDDSNKRISEINSQLDSLNKRVRNLQMQKTSIVEANKTLQSVLKKRQGFLEQILDRKERIRTLRTQKIKDIRKKIGNVIALKLIPDANREQYVKLIVEMMQGSYTSKSTIEQICQTIPPGALVKLIQEQDFNTIDKLSNVGTHPAKKFVDVGQSKLDYLFRIEAMEMEDVLEISLEVEKGEYRPIEKLSTGQKAVVIVQLSMSEGNQPIIFDQPEDALYTPFIYNQVVKTLLQEKDQRQFILATHNPNIVIGGDTDYSIVLEGTSEQTFITASGGLDDQNTKLGLVTHLEGGEKAFIVRQSKLKIVPK